MSIPATRADFKAWCLRALGDPVIQINVDDDQVEDRIDEAIKYYWDYHFDGTEKMYYKHQITDDDKTNKYIIMPDNIIGAVRIFQPYGLLSSSNMFDIRYQMALNDMYSLTNVSMVPYVMAMTHLQFLQQLLVGEKPIRYNRNRNILYVDMNWETMASGEYIIVEAYQIVDPEQFTDMYGDRWLLEYSTALIKRQWGNNLKKYDGMSLPGGMTFNGQKIFDEAEEEIKKLRAEMISSYSLPVSDMIG